MESGSTPLPPGQVWGRRWVIYAALGVPEVDVSKWRLRIDGLVQRPVEFTYQQLQQMEQTRYSRPFSCVTKWSIREVEWEGVQIRRLAKEAVPDDESRWVMFHCADGYKTPVPSSDTLSEDAIVALKINGLPLTREQGFPARPFIPNLYGWKSAKWLVRVEFMREYRDGYWEMYGYHERGNIWEEERFKGGTGTHSRRKSIGTIW
jgi:DMSO/TMAO reductase YedYZ molybdopterin-dependent catalytic subunit